MYFSKDVSNCLVPYSFTCCRVQRLVPVSQSINRPITCSDFPFSTNSTFRWLTALSSACRILSSHISRIMFASMTCPTFFAQVLQTALHAQLSSLTTQPCDLQCTVEKRFENTLIRKMTIMDFHLDSVCKSHKTKNKWVGALQQILMSCSPRTMGPRCCTGQLGTTESAAAAPQW